jgi:signal transduction histidine kinase/HAMP domain-containing protein/ActR/RegA family two-component response regulator
MGAQNEQPALAPADPRVERLLAAVRAVRQGDFRKRVVVTGDDALAEVCEAFNEIAEYNQRFKDDLVRVGDAVGRDGLLGRRIGTTGGSGDWQAAVDAANGLLDNLSSPLMETSRVLAAVADGDLSQQVAVGGQGDMAVLAKTMNSMTQTLRTFASEVTRVALEYGSEGRLGGRAEVPGVAGTWKDLTDSVNLMAGNLTAQVRDISSVATGVARGDLSRKITVDVRGEMLELKTTLNTMVDQLSAFAAEVTRVAREVGSEGALGGQARVPGVDGTWKDLTDSVNQMAGNLTAQVRNIAQVATAVAQGDLTKKIDVDARGEILELKDTLNTMVDQLSAFAAEVTRMAREVGTEGILGGQAQVPGVAGTWRDLTDSVNFMAGNLTTQVRNIAHVTTAVAQGDLTKKIDVDARGEIAQLKTTINTMVDQLRAFADEVTRVAREVGTEGNLGGQATVSGVSGTWKDLTDNVNVMADNLTGQVRSIAAVASAVAGGDLSKKITVDAKGEVAGLADTINGMVDTLSAFADEVTRVAREVGTEGILGGQARVPGVAGTWKDLTDNVNLMAYNLTGQVRNIAQVTTAVAQGDLTKKIDVDARGEILELKTTINTMVDQLSAFASEVTRVAREVGTAGILGGQAEVEGVSGTWRKLTEGVNQLAANLTAQVRAIAGVATAVTAGDLTRRVDVEASGEVAELKDNINQMIVNLGRTTRTNQEQDWLKTNFARISGLLQGQRDLAAMAGLIMGELAPLVNAQSGAFYLAETADGPAIAGEGSDGVRLRMIAGYGNADDPAEARSFALGQSLVGQVAVQKKTILVTGGHTGTVKISSGLGTFAPAAVIVLPVLFEGQSVGVVELATVNGFTSVHQDFMEQLKEAIGVAVNTITASSRTDALLRESQRLTGELQSRRQALEESNSELAKQNRDIEVKNAEIERARRTLEERARQLSLASKVKSEFMANMSHELRTPLNSLLILAKLLADNHEGNLSGKQVDFASTIYSAGSDLLGLINDILDLSKIEAGRMEVRNEAWSLDALVDYITATFQPLAAEKGLTLDVAVTPGTPTTITTDEQRLQQVLRNLLSNAIKFTEHGGVTLTIAPRTSRTGSVSVEFSVTDTGIGISEDKLELIFEAFQQADGTTSRQFGGTGLGLSICKELTRLLGAELTVESEVGRGSTFTLLLPVEPSDSAATDEPSDVPTQRERESVAADVRGTSAGPEGTDGPDARAMVLVVEPPQRSVLHAATESAVAGLAGIKGRIGIVNVPTAIAVTEALAGVKPICVVVDLGLPQEVVEGVFEAVCRDSSAPVVVYESAANDGWGERLRAQYSGRCQTEVVRSASQIVERLTLHLLTGMPRAAADASDSGAHEREMPRFNGEKVLVIDDDIRNVFALTSALEIQGLTVVYAGNGHEGIEMLEQHEDIVLVLMDLMMPGMDGYATTAKIRRLGRFDDLPIIAVTAKAMKGDREKSLAAGTNEYVTKPVDVEALLILIRTMIAH